MRHVQNCNGEIYVKRRYKKVFDLNTEKYLNLEENYARQKSVEDSQEK